mgnify:CR=1 FL=1
MSAFDERQQAFEKKFAHDSEMQFKAEARRNKLLGLWAADLMGMGKDEAAAYAMSVIKSDFEEAGDEDVYRKDGKNTEGPDSWRPANGPPPSAAGCASGTA